VQPTWYIKMKKVCINIFKPSRISCGTGVSGYFFRITSKRITYKAAAVSVLVGIVLATVFVIDQLLGPETGKQIFPFLHYKLTLNFGYRALWAELFITAILFAVSAFTEKTDPPCWKKPQ